MLSLIGGLLGALWGAWLAHKRGGNGMDIAQYAVGYGIFWTIISFIVSIAIVNLT